MNKKTKIVCTIGPASASVKVLIDLIKNGLNVVRLNFSHGTYADQLEIINNLRKAEKITKQTIAIIQDLQGPKIRLGTMPEAGLPVEKDDLLVLSTKHNAFTEIKSIPYIPIQYKNLHKDIGPKDIVLIEDGLFKCQVISKNGQFIKVRALTKGLLKTHKGLNVSTASISADPLTKKDLQDLQFGLKHQVDYIALSFVRRASDIVRLKQIIKKSGSSAKVIAKIERHEALKNLEEITEATDAIMVARGDLGVEIPAEEVPIHQKEMVRLANSLGKPVIIATEMLQSMIEKPRATRAEISDAANAVFDHADALMLSNETAVGKYPVEAVQTLNKVSENIENYQKIHNFTRLGYQSESHLDSEEICYNAAELAKRTRASLIIAISRNGYTAQQISKQRIFTDIVVVTPDPQVKRELQLVWGINNVYVSKLNDIDQILKFVQKSYPVKKSGKVVIVSNASDKNRQIYLKQL